MKSFIEKSNNVHNKKYDYSEVNYLNAKTKVDIICPIHGIFRQTPTKHTSGQGCPKCYKEYRYGTYDFFIEKSNNVHNNKYDYSMVNYINNKTKVDIICPIHGIFTQSPKEHTSGQGCKECYKDKIRKGKDKLIIDFKKVHNNKYSYDIVEYKNMTTLIDIICPLHGTFSQLPKNHIEGKGCPECGYERKKVSEEDFGMRSNIIHGGKYDYTKTCFDNTKDKSIIICSIHGEFVQEINSHLNGSGCPKCSSSKGEQEVRDYLDKFGIKYTEQYTFDDCVYKNKLKFDFYLPEYNVCIEYDGIQHFKPVEHFGGYDNYKQIKKRDYIKNEYCENNNIGLCRIPFFEKTPDFVENFLKIYYL